VSALRLWRLARETGIAIALTAVLAAPFLYYVVIGVRSVPEVIHLPQSFYIDLLNFIVPPPITEFGKFGNTFVGSMNARFPMWGGYLGLPLILALAVSFQSPARYRLPLAILVLLFAIFSLGPSLWVNGVQTGMWLPWRIAIHLPIICQALPGRFTMFLFLVVAVVLARWLAERRPGPVRAARYALVLLGCLFVLPAHLPWSRLPADPFFTPDAIAGELPPGYNVIILPFSWTGPGPLWQEQSGMYFTQTGVDFGYLLPFFAPYAEIIEELTNGRPGRTFGKDLTAFVAASHVRDVLAAPGTPQTLLEELTKLNWPERTVGDMRIFHVPAASELQYFPDRTRLLGDHR
jgi:hypothetical protein